MCIDDRGTTHRKRWRSPMTSRSMTDDHLARRGDRDART
jgi:hypothetical protein